MRIVNVSKKLNKVILTCVRDRNYFICFNCFYFSFKNQNLIRKTKLCFGSFFLFTFLFIEIKAIMMPKTWAFIKARLKWQERLPNMSDVLSNGTQKQYTTEQSNNLLISLKEE